jgi:hypothetical protein
MPILAITAVRWVAGPNLLPPSLVDQPNRRKSRDEPRRIHPGIAAVILADQRKSGDPTDPASAAANAIHVADKLPGAVPGRDTQDRGGVRCRRRIRTSGRAVAVSEHGGGFDSLMSALDPFVGRVVGFHSKVIFDKQFQCELADTPSAR